MKKKIMKKKLTLYPKPLTKKEISQIERDIEVAQKLRKKSKKR